MKLLAAAEMQASSQPAQATTFHMLHQYTVGHSLHKVAIKVSAAQSASRGRIP